MKSACSRTWASVIVVPNASQLFQPMGGVAAQLRKPAPDGGWPADAPVPRPRPGVDRSGQQRDQQRAGMAVLSTRLLALPQSGE